MRAVVQRVRQGRVAAAGETAAAACGAPRAIGPGLVVFLGVCEGDGEEDAARLARKTAHLRIFADAAGKMNLSVLDTGGAILAVSQFTLYADTSRGHRPSFTLAAPPQTAEPLYLRYVLELRNLLGQDRVATGVFGAVMSVEIVNDGPVTIILDSA